MGRASRYRFLQYFSGLLITDTFGRSQLPLQCCEHSVPSLFGCYTHGDTRRDEPTSVTVAYCTQKQYLPYLHASGKRKTSGTKICRSFTVCAATICWARYINASDECGKRQSPFTLCWYMKYALALFQKAVL